jgi:amino acid transporter
MGTRFGLALILIGVIVLLVFLVTYSAGAGSLYALLAGSGLCLIGLWIRRLAERRMQREAGRFRALRHVLGREGHEEDS